MHKGYFIAEYRHPNGSTIRYRCHPDKHTPDFPWWQSSTDGGTWIDVSDEGLLCLNRYLDSDPEFHKSFDAITEIGVEGGAA